MTTTDPRLVARVARHRAIETELHALDDDELVGCLSDPKILEHGHAAIDLPRGNAKVFVKLVPLSDLELQPQHRHSTANLFQLPAYYQYRLGGCGLGAWRELEVHRLANAWVLSGQCPHFPLLHDWRVLPIVGRSEDDRMSLKAWGGHPAIERRIASVAAATSSVTLFLEYFPLTLAQWFRDPLPGNPEQTVAVRETEAALLEPLAFMNDQGLLHMDAHFENMLTDGSQFFLSDFGLATSRTFRLDAEELSFFQRHQNFDRCTVITSHVHALVTQYDSKADWRQTLRELNAGTHGRSTAVPAAVRSYLARRGPLALAVGDFYRRLTAELTTEYPASDLQRLLDDV